MTSHASMNRIYRLVWNAALNVWMAVAENTKGAGKGGSSRSRAGFTSPTSLGFHLNAACGAALVLLAVLLSPSAHAANAADAIVSSGAGSVATAGATTTITQASQRLAIDWTSLSTAAGEALVFNQPNASAIALNRITGANPSEFLGSLTANGQVFILNPNGVLFGAGSQVNVGGLVASTLSMSNADLESGNFKFSGSGAGSVVNQGTLNAAPGGYLALLAPEVRNEGVMAASLGTALLAAGNKVTLNLDNGSLLGYSIDQGAINALAENKQLIQADGGQVLLSAKAMDSLTTATVNNTGVIEAKTIQNKAGRIMLMGDMEHGTVNVGGTLDVSAPNGGDGGFVETSAAHVKVSDEAVVTAKAATGKTGTWLIDPTDFTIGVDESGAHVADSLALADRSIAATGNVNVNEAVSWNANKLTLTAGNNIHVNANLHASGSASLALEYGQSAVAAGNTSDYILKSGVSITLPTGQSFSTRQGSDGVQKDYTVITSLGAEGSTTAADLQGINGNLAGNYVLGGDIDAADTAAWESGAGFNPIATGLQFTGTFAGLGHSISNLTINRTTNNVGLISDTEAGAVVRDVGLVNANVIGNESVGALLGRNDNGVVRNSYATGSVEGTSWVSGVVAGLVGLNVGGTIKNSYATATVTGNGTQVGGLVGLNWAGTIDSSYATGDVTSNTYNYAGGAAHTARGNQVGGLVGNNYQGTITNSYATGNVTASGKLVGGLVGMNETGTISNSHATGAVIAGTIANVQQTGERVGGLVGENYSGTITNSYATGSVSGIWIYVGGLVGYSNGTASRPGGTILNSYATGNVNGVRWVGGLVGYDNIKGVIRDSYATGDVTGSSQLIGGLVGATTEGTISNTYATGKVTLTGLSDPPTDWIGGLVGASTRSTVTNSYWNTDTTGQPASAAGTGLSTAQIQQQASYSGFDFNNTWVIYEGHTTPLLRSFMKTLTVTSNATKVYDGLAYAFNPATDVSYSLVADPALLNGTLSNSGASEGAIHVSQSGAAITLGGLWSGQQGYLINYAGGALTITPKTITVAATGTDKVYDGSTAAAVTLGGSGVIAGDVVDFTGLTASFDDKNAGTGKLVTVSGISLSGASAGDYSLGSTSASTTADITRKAITVTATADNKTYDGSATASVALASSGLVGGDVVNFANTAATFDDKNAGTSKAVAVSGISASGTDADNYSLNNSSTGTTADIAQKAITVTATAANKTYDGDATASVVLASSGLVEGDVVNFANTAATFGDKNAGISKAVSVSGISASGDDVGNYSLANSSAGATADITPRALTVTGLTADNKVYDQGTGATVNTADAVYTGLIGGDAFSVGATGTFSDKNAGAGKTVNLVSHYAGADVGNYAITDQAATTASISRAALTVSGITADDKTYNASDAATVNTAGAAYNGLFAGDVLGVAATGLFSDKNVGTNKTVALTSSYSGADAGNYVITGQATTTAGIGQASLTLSTSDVVKTYDAGTSAAGTAVVSGGTLFGSDSLSGGSFAFTNKNAGTGDKLVKVSGVTVGDGINNSNYNISYADNTTSTIHKAALTISGVTAFDKTYNASDAATVSTAGAAYGGLFARDVVNVAATGLFGDKNVGTGKTVTLTSSYTGADAGNYAITGQTSTHASISQAALTVSGITASDKTYNASDAATVNTAGAAYNGLFAGDVVSVAATGLFSDKNAGSNKTVNLSSSYAGADAGNYAITDQTSTTASISQAALTVSGITAGGKTYDAGVAATVDTAGASYGGLFAGDVVNVAATGVFSDKNAGVNKTVNLSSSYTGADVGNYVISSQAGATATIGKADLTVQATGASKVYDGTAAATVAFSGNGLAGDVLDLTGSASFADKNAGLNKTVSITGIAVGGADAGNYNLVNGSTATTADITPKQLTVTANDDKQMGGMPYSGGNGVSYNGLAAGDTAATVLTGGVVYGGTAQGAYLPGEYAITPGGLLANGNYSMRFMQGRLTLSGGDVAAAALGGNALVSAYGGAVQAVADVGTSLGGSGAGTGSGGSGGGAGGSDASALAAAAAEAGNSGEDE